MTMTKTKLTRAAREIRCGDGDPIVMVRQRLRNRVRRLANEVVERADPLALANLIGYKGRNDVSVWLAGGDAPERGLETALWNSFADSLTDDIEVYVDF